MAYSGIMTDRELVARIAHAPGGKAGYKQLVRELNLGGGLARGDRLEPQLDVADGDDVAFCRHITVEAGVTAIPVSATRRTILTGRKNLAA